MARRAYLVLLAFFGIGCASYVLPLPFGMTVNVPASSGAAMPETELMRRIRLPEGFSINSFAAVPNARMLRFTPTGDLLVSSTRLGSVYLVERDANGDGVADGTRVLLERLDRPHGLAWRDGWLYVGESGAITRVRFDPATRHLDGQVERFLRGLPAGGSHYTRTVNIGPDGKLYVSIGSSCNVCIEEDRRRATIMRYDLDGTGEEVYASGLRNSVGFAWQPGTGKLFATDNGRDYLGDDFPPCEFNQIVEGGFYGWPFANGNRVPDPDYGEGHEAQIASSLPPAHGFGAHTAPLGMTFYDGSRFPEQYRGAVFVAQHGSWNRSKKSGYKVVALSFNADGGISEADFATGFEIDEQVAGRPVDVAVGPDGALYVSDDYAGAVYRISFGQRSSGSAGASEAVRPRAGDPLAALDPGAREAASARGLELWTTTGCVNCHEPGHLAGGGYKALEKLGSKYGIDSLAAYLRAPQTPMPAYPLSDEQRRDLAIYLLGVHGS